MKFFAPVIARGFIAPAALATLLLVATASLVAPVVHAAVLPTGFIDQLVAQFLNRPTGCAQLPDGRFVVVEQRTRAVRLVKTGSASTPIFTFSAAVVDTLGAERGLLGVAVDPGWPARPYFYFQFTGFNGATPVVVLQRLRATGSLSDSTSFLMTLADPYTILNDCPDNDAINNGGTLAFGPDSMLYMSLGDDRTPCQSQVRDSLEACILRLDVLDLPDGAGGPPDKALITPADNPFVGSPDPETRLMVHYGLRNPFRFTIDRVSGAMYIGDVGQNAWEEVDEALTPGLNFGWPRLEGMHRYAPGDSCPGDSGTVPIYEYAQGAGNYSVMCGPRYRAATGTPAHEFPVEYMGDLFIFDYYQGWIRRLRSTTPGVWALAPGAPGQPDTTNWAVSAPYLVQMVTGSNGALYTLLQFGPGFTLGQLRRIVPATAASVESPGPVSSASMQLSISPNPASSSGTVRVEYAVPHETDVTVEVYAVTGERVRTLATGRREAGQYNVEWDGLDGEQRTVPAGIYFLRLAANGSTVTRKVLRP